MGNYLRLGEHNFICDVCGYKRKSSEARKRWDGLITCEQDWESRHPQDLLRVRSENPSIPWARSEPTDTFILASFALGQSTINQEEINGFMING